ncbi:MAG TPA: hypothetical protein VKG43_08700 [Acidimicrobiales bacterium]|nr:hypothetical protein [Acidimicrobiales bacterium]
MRRTERSEAGQVGLVVLVVSLLIVGTLTAVAIGFSLNGSGGTNGAPGVATANDVAAKTTLQAAVTAASAIATGGNYDRISAATLGSQAGGITAVAGASTSPTTVSVAVSPGSAPVPVPESGGSGGATGVTIPGNITLPPGVTAPGGAAENTPPAVGGSGGTVTLGVYSQSGTCWYAWLGAGAVWYGAQTGQQSCTAPALAAAPVAAPVSSTAIGWQPNSAPVA